MIKKFPLFLLMICLAWPASAVALSPNDDYYSELWYLDQIQAEAAWGTTIGSNEVVVAVLDTGVDLDHPDLAQNIWINSDEIDGNGLDDDHNGYVDDRFGWDFIDNDNDPEPDHGAGANEDAVAHGSVIAGIIGAVGNNSAGVVGVNWQVSIMPVRMLNDIGVGSSAKAIEAINYAVENGADVINLSFSGHEDDPELRETIQAAYEAGVVIVSALGNEAQDTDTDPVYPACYYSTESDWVIGVASSNEQDRRSTFSNYGELCVDISAPGENIFGVSYQNAEAGFAEAYDGYWSGTSMASPLVAGAAALLLSVYPSLTPDEVNIILKLSVDPMTVGPAMRGQVGAGRLNLARAIEYGASFVGEDSEDEIESPQDEDETGSVTLSGEYGASPATGELEEIYSVPAGNYITSPSYSTVYYVDDQMKRHPFMDTNTYFTYADSFDKVVEVTDATLPTLSVAGLMLPSPGVVLVKIQSVNTVYLIEENPTDQFSPILRAIVSEEIATAMFGENWAEYVIDVSPSFFNYFNFGEDVVSVESVNLSLMKTRAELATLAQ